MKFELSKEQYEKYIEWRKSLPKVDYGAIGGGFHFVFTPTGIGCIVLVKSDCGSQIDLTEDDDF